MPAKSTLTQRRSTLGSSSEPSPAISSSPTMGPSSLSSIDTMADDGSSKGSAAKILIWVVIILITGIGLAFLIRGLTTNKENEPEEQEEVTPPPAEEPIEEEPTTEEPEEEEPIEEEPEEEPTEEEPEEETPTTGDGLTNEYSTANQTLGEGLTTNTVNITGYSYSGFASNFVYTAKMTNSDTFPTVTATLDQTEKTLTVVVSNVKTDGIVGNGGEGSTTFAAPRNVTSVDIENASNKTTFVFNLNKATQYKIYADGGNLKVDIKNT